MKIKLTPEKVDFRISTTDLEVIYTESGGVVLRIDVQTFDDMNHDKYREVTIGFKTVAELKCITLNFFESKFNEFEIESGSNNRNIEDFWKVNGYSLNPNFYQVINSEALEKKNKIYDPKGRLDLKHYLIIGCDSYLEIIASQYDLL